MTGSEPPPSKQPTREPPQWPPAETWMDAVLVVAPHPATLADAELLADCDLRTQRRSGPGGQHRNKTDSGVFLTHRPTGVVGEATEKRSQADNRGVALQRLRLRLAVEVRTAGLCEIQQPRSRGSNSSQLEPDSLVEGNEIETRVRDSHRGSKLRFNEANPNKAAVLALVMNDLHTAGGQPSLVRIHWQCSTSALVALLKSHPPAIEWVNRVRSHHGRPPLR